ncbi:RNA methyltransferase [Anaerocolumna cellulosilytica]|uniref:RNA methyltransferase n=1 Tax=Anaerocolumna cellulosilytica TaxID=433286 RepID=A0A6S6R5U1_9FIRM|nr:16S rRNA (guanine(966)-N(2))-methyltransferase RsmD [Anaerocolumna cellulosilytica]MBB5197447.1 16S rRNA (guanine(966)-N(2))-methyltransferase RsmD [Anaerocolumna cellulosilytica]BCJ95467.1 RNA methyltransferase [Anaerocolumna cellulosilytica]
MRVIAGKAKRIQLKTIEGFETRPTTDRIKETLFNMLNHTLPDSVFLDLFSGSGGIGIEALSRGARTAVFVENNKSAAECINLNLKNTKLNEDAHVLQMEVMQALKVLETQEKSFDIVFMDPPYNKQIEKQILIYLAGSHLVHRDTIIIVEASVETSFDYLQETGFTIYKEKAYKTNKHVFIEIKDSSVTL